MGRSSRWMMEPGCYGGAGSGRSETGAEIFDMWMSDPLDDCNEGK